MHSPKLHGDPMLVEMGSSLSSVFVNTHCSQMPALSGSSLQASDTSDERKAALARMRFTFVCAVREYRSSKDCALELAVLQFTWGIYAESHASVLLAMEITTFPTVW